VFYAAIVFVAFLSDDENGINWKTEIAEYVMHVKLKSLAYTSTATPWTYYDLSSLLRAIFLVPEAEKNNMRGPLTS
jgi:hypothetical protein